ncbi:hypothetical protein ABES33_00615 [Bacillus pseudomycoides]|uniref:hypothetical protein n=1 Tax=Bacillus TaxID=1386 RepID=UPI000360D778|nr:MULTISPECIES: hypothetical protein [Bacillus]
MIWKIEDKKDFLWYTSDECQLKIKVNEDKVNIWLNYNGYNIIMPMGMWGFDDEVSERGLKYCIGGDHMQEWYYIVDKKDLRLFVDLIYFFIEEHDADKMINPKLGIKGWN